MKIRRRRFLHLAAGTVVLPVVSRMARAQTYPTRPVRLIVGVTAGGSADILARLMGQWLSERLGQPFVIENRPGAGGNIATEAAVHAAADGYTLLVIGVWNAIDATLYDKLNFNFISDIAPVASVALTPAVMVVTPSFPPKTVTEFIAYAKANPGKVNYGSAGMGSPNHMAGELFKMMTGVNMLHVPYRGVGEALTDMLRTPARPSSARPAPTSISAPVTRPPKWRGASGSLDASPYCCRSTSPRPARGCRCGRTALEILGETNVAPERLTAKFVEIGCAAALRCMRSPNCL